MESAHSLSFSLRPYCKMAFAGLVISLTIITIIGVKPVIGQTKAEQCRTASELVQKYEKQAAVLAEELAYNSATETAARNYLSNLNKSIVDPNRNKPGHFFSSAMRSPSERRDVVERMGLVWDERFENDDVFLLQKLRDRQIEHVTLTTYVLAHMTEIKDQKAEVDRQIALQKQRILDLKCSKTAKPPVPPPSKGDLSGTWVATVPNPASNCTIIYSFTLAVVGKEAWTGPLSSLGNCKSQPPGVIGQLNLTVIGPGILKGNLAGQQLKATFDSSRISMQIIYGEVTFVRK